MIRCAYKCMGKLGQLRTSAQMKTEHYIRNNMCVCKIKLVFAYKVRKKSRIGVCKT